LMLSQRLRQTSEKLVSYMERENCIEPLPQ
jgi:hypothetical protein